MRALQRLKDRNMPQPVDLDEEFQNADSLAEDLRRVAMGEIPVDQYPQEYAPPQRRVEDEIMDGKEELQSKITETIDQVHGVVLKEIASMRAELDSLEAVAKESCEAAKQSLENQLNIAAHSMKSCNQIREQISSFREIVKNNLPR